MQGYHLCYYVIECTVILCLLELELLVFNHRHEVWCFKSNQQFIRFDYSGFYFSKNNAYSGYLGCNVKKNSIWFFWHFDSSSCTLCKCKKLVHFIHYLRSPLCHRCSFIIILRDLKLTQWLQYCHAFPTPISVVEM